MPLASRLKKHGIISLGQRLVKIFAVATVLLLDGVGMRVVADGEPIGAVVAFAPPAIEDAKLRQPWQLAFMPLVPGRPPAAGAGCSARHRSRKPTARDMHI